MELDGVDEYKYRYYITGEVGDLDSLPSNPKPDSEALYFPYTLRCHRGVTVDEYKSSLEDGFTTAHTPVKHDGYAHVKNPVKCLDGKAKTDYDWLALKDTTEVVCNFDGAASATVSALALAERWQRRSARQPGRLQKSASGSEALQSEWTFSPPTAAACPHTQDGRVPGRSCTCFNTHP